MSTPDGQLALFPKVLAKRLRVELEQQGKAQKRELRKTAREARDDGMARVAAAVERVMPRWYDLAMEAVRQYALKHDQFMCEAARADAEAKGLKKPHEKRAWGNVMRNAARAGYVTKVGLSYASDPKVHMNPAGLWKSRIYREGA